MFQMKFMDGSRVPDDYSNAVSKLISHSAQAEERIGIDELEDFATRKRDVQAVVLNCLREHGWFCTDGAALAIKPFQTAVGVKNACVYFSGGDYNFTLQGDYQSEGRNSLEPHCVLIPVNAGTSDILRLTSEFSHEADSVVADTYAASLFRRFQQ
jgi:hypothetical protein